MAVTETDAELYSEIADYLSDAIRGTDNAYGLAVEAWGADDPRSRTINEAWAEVETAFCEFHKGGA